MRVGIGKGSPGVINRGILGASAGFGGGIGHWAIILWSLNSFLILPKVLSRSTTREVTRMYHVYN